MQIQIRGYRPEDVAEIAQLFYDTVHHVNAADYTPSQLRAWANGQVDLAQYIRTYALVDGTYMENYWTEDLVWESDNAEIAEVGNSTLTSNQDDFGLVDRKSVV